MEPMRWDKLLSPIRIRELLQGTHGASHRSRDEFRNEFERDYGRALFSTPVRRLLDKAQVFPLDPHDSIRTRLTHSHEVASVARNLARAIAAQLLEDARLEQTDQATAIEEIATTCALIHDLGNPPFGHAGERAIQDWFESNGIPSTERDTPEAQEFTGFDGNAQTIRLISRLQFISDPYGLNLTSATLSASLKYIADASTVNPGSHALSKIGVFATEREVRDAVQDVTGTGMRRNPITHIVEACDDIVYSTVDIEDGIKKGAVAWDFVAQTVNDSRCELLMDALGQASKYVDRDPSLKGGERDMALSQMFRTFVLTQATPAVRQAFFENYSAIMDGELDKELVKLSVAAEAVSVLKKIGRENIYIAPSVLRLEVMGRHVIHDLLQIFYEAVEQAPSVPIRSYGEKLYRLMSSNYKRAFDEASSRAEFAPWYLRLRLLVDYVAGMTDSYARDLHSQLLNG